MDYRVEALAAAAGVNVDTVRFYQSRGLLPPPRREGRVALYDDAHLERLRRIRKLQQQGFKLAQIRRVLAPRESEREPLLEALVERRVGGRSFTRTELAAQAGVPEALVAAAVSSGLVEPMLEDGVERFGESDLEMARAGLEILEAGFPLPPLLELAVGHARHVGELCDAAIELFDQHVREHGPGAGDDEAVAGAFRRLLPQVTRLVALHFERTLVARALARLEGRGESEALEAARATVESAQLEVDVGWR